MEAATEAWRFSRDVLSPVRVEDVFKVDVPVCEMPSCVMAMSEFTILEREVLLSPRSHVAWARTSHVDDPLEFRIPDELVPLIPTDFVDHQRTLMRRGRDAGQSQDEWREELPLMSMTSWEQRISYRDLVKITSYVASLSTDERLVEAVRHRFLMLNALFRDVLNEFLGSYRMVNEALDTFQQVRFLCERPLAFAEGVTETEGHYAIRMSVPLWLRAQIVRHRNLSFVDDLFQVLTSPDVLVKTIREPMRMELSATKDFWQSVLSKRSCWLAQDSLSSRRDLWQRIIDQFGGGRELLPCAGGLCPYEGDAALRLTDADPGVPCPRYMNIKELDKNDYRVDMDVAARSRATFWRAEIWS